MGSGRRSFGKRILERVAYIVAPPTPHDGVIVANWQSGIATSGEVGADYITLTDKSYYGLMGVPLFYILIGNLTGAATITYRIYILQFGAMRLVDDDTYVVGVDPDIMPIGAWITHGPMRIEIQSDAVGDNGARIPYEYTAKPSKW